MKNGRGRPKTHSYHRLTPTERARMCGQFEGGTSINKLAKEWKVDKKTVRSVVRKGQVDGNFNDKPRSGRPKKTSPREKRTMKIKSVKDRFLTGKAMAIKEAPNFTKNRVSVTSAKRILREAGLWGRVARKKPLLRRANIDKRLEWAKKYAEWNVDDWKNVIFSDESPFTLFQINGKQYVRRRPGEEYNDECILPTVKHGGGSIQVWGCFSWWGKGPLHWIKGKMDGPMYREILKGKMAPFLKNMAGGTGVEPIFQQDNDPKHTSKVAKNYLSNKSIVVLDWPSQSPDMNPIEHAWNGLKHRIEERAIKASSLNEVFEIAKEEWENYPMEDLRHLISSMPNRCKELKKAKGKHTHY
jgi:transposase